MGIKKIDYSQIKSGLIQRGEEIFPFRCFNDIKIDWDAVIVWMNANIPEWVEEIEWKCKKECYKDEFK